MPLIVRNKRLSGTSAGPNGTYLEAFMDADVIPLIEGPEGVSLQAYKRHILERFANPAIGDQLLRIAGNGVAKLPIFLSTTLAQLVERGGGYARVALCLACFARYLTGRDLQGGPLVVDEPLLTDRDRALLASGDPLAVLRLSAFAALGLSSSAAFKDAFLAARARLAAEGPMAALAFATTEGSRR